MFSDKEDEDSKESDKEKEVPLLDQPLEKSGKRERKNVQRFNEEFASEPKETVSSTFHSTFYFTFTNINYNM